MQLIESYVQEVSQYLPAAQRQDIVEELRGAIVDELYAYLESKNDMASAGEIKTEVPTQMDGHLADEGVQAASIARLSPSIEDEKTILARFGHPLKLAGTYQPPKALIGSEIYPAYTQTLKLIMIVAIVVQIVASLVFGSLNGSLQETLQVSLEGWHTGPFELLTTSINILIWVFIVVTLVFVAIEKSEQRLGWYDSWDPQSISRNTIGVINRQDVITNLLSEGFFLLWWNDVLVFFHSTSSIEVVAVLSPVWDAYFWPLNIMFGAAFMLHTYVLVKGVWGRFELIAEIFINTALLALGLVLLGSGDLFEVTLPTEATSDEVEAGFANGLRILDYVQNIIRTVVLVIMGFILWDIWQAFKILRGHGEVEGIEGASG